MRFSGHAQVYDHDDSLLAASWLRKGFLQCGVYHPNLTHNIQTRFTHGYSLLMKKLGWKIPWEKMGFFPLIFEQVS